MFASNKVLIALEYDKILYAVSEYAVLDSSKNKLKNTLPCKDFYSAEISLNTTIEADKLLYNYSVSGVDFFDEITDELERAQKGAVLSCAELLRVMRLLQSSRITRKAITIIDDPTIVYLRRIAEQLFTDYYLEDNIREKIVSEDTLSDNASETLYQIRRKIKRLNEQIREKLSSYVRGAKMKYLQENIITMRGDRYVIPVKSEYRSQIKGLVHDQSSTGATVFIEPEAVLELNNDLKTALIEENVEVEKILSDLSHSVGMISGYLNLNIEYLSEIDVAFAKAEYAYKTKSFIPKINNNGYICIKKGRHPLIDKHKVVPLDIVFGDKIRFLLITGPNTGGKTVSLKLVGLFSLMAMSGMFIPAAEGSEISHFDQIFSDIGDEQSIEQSLSTFSSHMSNIIEITKNANEKSLILLDELGAGTDPDEGSALAQAVIERLLDCGSRGIITTHYSRLKEFAYSRDDLMNASMDFDSKTFSPLYRIVIGMPGSSNAIEISKRLGLDDDIAKVAYSLLSDSKISFENVIKEAEKTRNDAEKIKNEFYQIKRETEEDLAKLKAERAKFESDKERFLQNAKAEARRLVNDRVDQAEELIESIKQLLSKQELSSGDIITARTLKNKIENVKYDLESESVSPPTSKPVDITKLNCGDRVYVSTMDSFGIVQRVSSKKKEVEVLVGSVRVNLKPNAIFYAPQEKQIPKKPSISIARRIDNDGEVFKPEINVIGQNSDEALINVEKFLDSCVLNNIEECRIVHGKGLNILSKAIQTYLKKQRHVKEFRFGVYGEGEKGVTIVKLK